jgi:carbamoylphosphate synthase large subunit
MRKFVFAKLLFVAFGLTALVSTPLAIAAAHEGHKMECNETNINAMNADIQAMKDGEDKTTAMKAMQMAQDMMAKQDMKGCMAHMHDAMEATEK